jgi:uncharacterized protein (TIGR02722 family)
MRKFIYLMLLTSLLATFGCVRRDIRSSRYDDNRKANHEWSGEDTESTSRELIAQMMSDAWYARAVAKKTENEAEDTRPFIVLGDFKNKTTEHIESSSFLTSLKGALISSGKIKFVSKMNRSHDLRKNVDEGILYSSEETAKSIGDEDAADYMLFGEITSITNRDGGVTYIYYQINVELHDTESHEVVWVGEKKIKKKIVQRRSSW